jgi:cytochrome c-type biogenesis protein CcmH
MIFLLMLALALLLMLPLFLSFAKGRTPPDRRETALAIHRAQLAELAKDLTEGRIGKAEYAGAKLEIERRLLSADGLTETRQDGNARGLLVVTAILVPIMAFMLYLPGSTPDLPSEPHAKWLVRQQAEHQQAQVLIAALRVKLQMLDPNSAEASQGQAYLAEALAEDAGQLTPESIALFKQSIRNAPPDAAWRKLDEQRLVEANAAALQ